MLMMMMMMKKNKGSLAAMALLVASVNCVTNPSKENLSGEFHHQSDISCPFKLLLRFDLNE